MSVESALELFTQLLAAPSPSGREEGVAHIIRSKLDEIGVAHETDGAGNVLVRLAGQQSDGPLICYAAHMDEIGMVVTAIAPNGDLLVDRSGGLFPWKLGEGPVEVMGDSGSIVGIASMGSTHTPNAASQSVQWSDVRIITGLSPAQLADAGIRPGSTAVPTRERCGPVVFGDSTDPLVGAWTFDDRMGVVALLRLLQTLKANGTTPLYPSLVAFTVHEEGGGHGAKILAATEVPDIFVSIDGSPIPPDVPLSLDGRPGVWSKDRLAHYDQRLVRAFCESAVAAGTEAQPVVFAQAASDASLVYAAGGVHRAACFGHVRENSHGYEVARLSGFDRVLDTLIHFVTENEFES